jgi:hypothetical protein
MEEKPVEAGHPLTRKAVWISLVVATAVPFLMLVAIIVLMITLDFNFLNWME